MDCISDPVCIYNGLVSAVTHGAAFLDYIGYSVLGEQWLDLVPVVEDYAGELRRLASLISPQPVNHCEAAAGQAVLNA